ncbi:hypothetical protein DL771_005821 [Monosporascus sp. 5C6A]|nr:hypothetical protein DL771_005821 [Monosporascus sp. 5C6A]
MASTDSSRLNLGPLTTAFTYPPGCDVAVITSGASIGYQAQTCSNNPNAAGGEQDNPDCWPPRLYGNLNGGIAFGGWGFYSPGLECPDGGFDCLTDQAGTRAQTCLSVVTEGSFLTVQCSYGSSNNYGHLEIPLTYTVTSSDESATGVSEVTSVSVYAPLFQLVHRPSDIPSIPAETTSDAGVRTASSELDDGLSTSSGNPNGGLPTGARAGVGVGVGIAVFAIIGAAFFFWGRRRTVATEAPKQPGQMSGQYGQIPGQYHLNELPVNAPTVRSELYG